MSTSWWTISCFFLSMSRRLQCTLTMFSTSAHAHTSLLRFKRHCDFPYPNRRKSSTTVFGIIPMGYAMKLAGSSWGANANTLRSSALALCYSVAEYCCPEWQRSTHVSLVDAQLHSSMRLISGTVRSIPLPWLPVLTNIEPPALRRRAATDKLITQAECHRHWPLYDDVFHPPPLHLESHKPLWRDLQTIDVTSR